MSTSSLEAQAQEAEVGSGALLPDGPVRARSAKIGAIGAGAIMADQHLAAYNEAGFPVVAIASRTKGNAERVAERWNIPTVHDTPELLIEDPDGAVLMLGTMFAPIVDRDQPDHGFTHHAGDVVRISSPALGSLVGQVQSSEGCAPWTFGIAALMRNLAARRLL